MQPTQSVSPSEQFVSRPILTRPTTKATTTTTTVPPALSFLENQQVPSSLNQNTPANAPAGSPPSFLINPGIPSSLNQNTPATGSPPPFLVNPIIPNRPAENPPTNNNNNLNLSESEARQLQERLLSSLLAGFGLPATALDPNNSNNPSGNPSTNFKRSPEPSIDEIRLKNLLDQSGPTVLEESSHTKNVEKESSTLTKSTLELLSNPLLKKLIEATILAEKESSGSQKDSESTVAPISIPAR